MVPLYMAERGKSSAGIELPDIENDDSAFPIIRGVFVDHLFFTNM